MRGGQLAFVATVLCSLSGGSEGKKKKSSKDWSKTIKAIEEEEREEWQREREEREAEAAKNQPQFDMSDPGKWIASQGGVENAMMMQGGGGGGSAMTFVHLNNETVTSKEQAEEMVVQWRDLLMTAGIEVGVYVIEPHLLLLDTSDKRKVIQIKNFIVAEAPGGAEHVEYFEFNQQKFYPPGKDPDPKPEWTQSSNLKKLKKGQLSAFNSFARRFMLAASEADAAKELKRATTAAADLKQAEEKESAAYYLKVMERMGDGKSGADYPKREKARLKNMIEGGKLSDDKKESFERRQNILKAFTFKKPKTTTPPPSADPIGQRSEAEQALWKLCGAGQCGEGLSTLRTALTLGDPDTLEAKLRELAALK